MGSSLPTRLCAAPQDSRVLPPGTRPGLSLTLSQATRLAGVWPLPGRGQDSGPRLGGASGATLAPLCTPGLPWAKLLAQLLPPLVPAHCCMDTRSP